MKYITCCLFLSFLLMACSGPITTSEKATPKSLPVSRSISTVTLAFYNVENLFDTEDEAEKIDEDFLPDGRYDWTQEKYEAKLAQLANAFASMGSRTPALIGLAEVENQQVVEDLMETGALGEHAYEVVHEESLDMRGIDVAFAYDPSIFTYVDHKTIRYTLPEDPHYTSRDMLLVEGKIGDFSLHFMVNHWPSRRDGEKESEFKRVRAAELAREAVNEILAEDPDAHIILVGDFNDDPDDTSIEEVLLGEGDLGDLSEDELYNPLQAFHDPQSQGTLTHQGAWNLFDQILLSESFVDGDPGLQYISGSATIYTEGLNVGFGRGSANPRRAIFRGKFDPEGFSDHFPVGLRLKVVAP